MAMDAQMIRALWPAVSAVFIRPIATTASHAQPILVSVIRANIHLSHATMVIRVPMTLGTSAWAVLRRQSVFHAMTTMIAPATAATRAPDALSRESAVQRATITTLALPTLDFSV
jgi:hypothetical protein